MELETETINVSCGYEVGVLFLDELCSGSKGKCILYKDKKFTPAEFEKSCGKERNRNWRRTLRHENRPLADLITSGDLKLHSSHCQCNNCTDLNNDMPILYEKTKRARKRKSGSPVILNTSYSSSSSSTSVLNTAKELAKRIRLCGNEVPVPDPITAKIIGTWISATKLLTDMLSSEDVQRDSR